MDQVSVISAVIGGVISIVAQMVIVGVLWGKLSTNVKTLSDRVSEILTEQKDQRKIQLELARLVEKVASHERRIETHAGLLTSLNSDVSHVLKHTPSPGQVAEASR